MTKIYNFIYKKSYVKLYHIFSFLKKNDASTYFRKKSIKYHVNFELKFYYMNDLFHNFANINIGK